MLAAIRKLKHSSLSAEFFRPYTEQMKRLLPEGAAFTLVSAAGEVYWSSFEGQPPVDERLLYRLRAGAAPLQLDSLEPDVQLVALPVLRHGELVAGVLLRFERRVAEPAGVALERVWRRLRPTLDRLGRELAWAVTTAPGDDIAPMDELEWLFALMTELQDSSGENLVFEQLLASAVEQMGASFAGLAIPDRQLDFTSASQTLEHPDAARAYQASRSHLLCYVQRRAATFVANRAANAESHVPPCKILAVPIARPGGRPAGLLAFYRPVSLPDFDRRQLSLALHIGRQAEALLDSQYDPATGLLTRAVLEREAAKLIELYGADEPHAVVYLDVDHLHIVNEMFGFDAGDEAIARIAGLLQPPCLPDNALAARIAGDCFVAFLPVCDTVQATQWCQSLQQEASRIRIGDHGQPLSLTVSCGVARVPGPLDPFSRAISAAELACRTAKERGGNRSEVYLDIEDNTMHRRSAILSVVRLRAALEKDRLQIFAQRIVPLQDLAKTSGIECLARLVAEDGEAVPPTDFVLAAQRYQLSRAIDEWIVRHALGMAQPYSSLLQHGPIHLSLNLSEQSLNDDEFLRALEDRLVRSSFGPGLVTLEITEAIALRNASRTEMLARRLKTLGCRLALDDFGASGHSASLLSSLKPDCVKIDGASVRDLMASPQAEATVRRAMMLAGAHRIDCVAMHAETVAITRRLAEIGIGFAQGNAIHQAEPLPALLETLADEESQQLRRLYLQ
jgi:diguanylate cyclase (GGDEF)-like protein